MICAQGVIPKLILKFVIAETQGKRAKAQQKKSVPQAEPYRKSELAWLLTTWLAYKYEQCFDSTSFS